MATKTSYVEVNPKVFTPINIIPSGDIKCVHCNIYVPNHQLESHSRMHIPQKYSHAMLKQNIRNTKITQRIDVKNFLNQQTDYEDISIKSILPQQMPKAQVVKKTIKLQNNHPLHSQITYKNLKSSQQPDNLSIAALEASLRHPQIHEERPKVKQKINLQYINMKIDYKSLKFYTQDNKKNDGWYDNKVVHVAKKKIQSQDTQQDKQNINVYVIMPITQKKKKDHKNQPVRIQITGAKKKPKYKQKISTISTSTNGEGFFRLSNMSLKTNTNSQFGLNPSKPSKFQCIQCRGFYCKACGSDIPPIYRPVPNNDNNSEVNQQIKQFLNNKTFFNKSQCKTSRLTGCTNCE